MTKYFSCAETAKLVRQALKESFPGIRFSVRSKTYSGGASINVDWTDGPNRRQVESITSQFEGAYFDGMIDYQGSRYHKMDGEDARFGANFIFEDRDASDAQIARAFRVLRGKYGEQIPQSATIEQYRNGNLNNIYPCGGELAGNNSLQCMLNQSLSKLSDRLTIAESPTLKRVKFMGDDGYGAGTVGRDGSGRDTGLGYPRYSAA